MTDLCAPCAWWRRSELGCAAMPTMCGELKEFESPVGGGLRLRSPVHASVAPRLAAGRFWTKHRMVFPRVRIGEQTLEKVFVASDGLGQEIAAGARWGASLPHRVRATCSPGRSIIGLRSRSGASYVMPPSGLTSGPVLVRGVLSAGASHPRGGSGDDRRDARRQAGNRAGLLFGVSTQWGSAGSAATDSWSLTASFHGRCNLYRRGPRPRLRRLTLGPSRQLP